MSLVFWTFAGGSRDAVEHAVALHRHPETFAREYSLSWTSSQVQLYHIGIKPAEAADYQKVAAYLLYPERTLRQPPETIASGLGKQSDLWPMSISGDYPIFCAAHRQRSRSRCVARRAAGAGILALEGPHRRCGGG